MISSLPGNVPMLDNVADDDGVSATIADAEAAAAAQKCDELPGAWCPVVGIASEQF